MSAPTVSNKSSKFTLPTIILTVVVFLFGLLYPLEFSPAKSWNVKILAECSLSLENKRNAKLILDQVSDKPRTGQVNRLIEKCRNLREEERLIRANELIAYAKKTLKTN